MYIEHQNMNETCRIRPIEEYEEWETLFAAIPQAYLVQSHAYGEAVRETRGLRIRHYAFEHSGRVAAICQVREKTVAGIPLASRIEHGPMFLDPAPSIETRISVMRCVRERWRLFKGGPVKIQPTLEDLEENRHLLQDLGYKDLKKGTWCSARIDLSLEHEELRKHLLPQWRRHLNAACRNSLELRSCNSSAGIEWLIKRHEENMRIHSFPGPSPAFVRALYNARPSDFHVFEVASEGEAVTGACWIRYGKAAQSFISWISEAGRKCHAGNFLFWNGILEMKKEGCRWLDVGGIEPSQGYSHFKQGMGGTEYRLVGDWVSY
jgi:hypothetical protein